MKLIGEFVAGAAATGAFGAAALDHEIRDDAMELEAVVKALVRQRDEVLDGFRGFVVKELNLDDAAGRFNRGDFHGKNVLIGECGDKRRAWRTNRQPTRTEAHQLI